MEGELAHIVGRRHIHRFCVAEPSAATIHECIVGCVVNIYAEMIVAEPSAATHFMQTPLVQEREELGTGREGVNSLLVCMGGGRWSLISGLSLL